MDVFRSIRVHPTTMVQAAYIDVQHTLHLLRQLPIPDNPAISHRDQRKRGKWGWGVALYPYASQKMFSKPATALWSPLHPSIVRPQLSSVTYFLKEERAGFVVSLPASDTPDVDVTHWRI